MIAPQRFRTIRLLLICITAIGLASCSSSTTDPNTPPPDNSLRLTTFDLKVGDKLIFETENIVLGVTTTTMDTIEITSVTGASGAQVLRDSDNSLTMMKDGYLLIPNNSGFVAIAQFPSKNGDTVAIGYDTLNAGNPQIYSYLTTSVFADTVVATGAGNQRCAVVLNIQRPLVEDGVAPISLVSSLAVSPKYGIIGYHTQSWAGMSTDGPPFTETTSSLKAIIRK